MTWQDTRLDPAGTHHLRNDGPLYAERFDEVLKFHEPGLAAVRRGTEAWHIRADGSAVYTRRFRRAFGFYEGLAAVVSPDGWHHVRPDGTDVSAARFDWCGNFQGGLCPVRENGGAYFHITPDGRPAYERHWRYAGDFRDGVAVVQAEDGCSSHIDARGALLHGLWFLDLDVFHKCLARARDEDGWTHVDAAGRPAYARRFAAVEPFYNGQAHVERFDGGLEVIDETGLTLVELRPAVRSELASLSGDLVGFWRTQTICAAVELGVFDALPATLEGIARSRGLDPARAYRLLRALAELRLATVVGDEWRATERGAYLKSTHPLTLAGAAVEYGRFFSRPWETLPAAIRAGSGWQPPDISCDVATDPARATAHHEMPPSYALHDYATVPAALGLRGDERVIDAGGGLGALAVALVKMHPGLRVVVLDRPEVIRLAARRTQPSRVELRESDFFRPWGVHGDAVVLSRVLHDWDDSRAVQVLHQARRALPTGGKLFVVEMLVPKGGVAGSLCDLHLLMATGGQERTAAEYGALLGQTGFDFEGVRRLPALPSVVVGAAR